jgi:hypothetical protein
MPTSAYSNPVQSTVSSFFSGLKIRLIGRESEGEVGVLRLSEDKKELMLADGSQVPLLASGLTWEYAYSA